MDSVALGGQVAQAVNVWFWIAIAEALVILGLISSLLGRKGKERRELKEKLKSSPVDFGNTINSAFNAKPLYDKLKTRCHPYRFANTPLEAEANTLFQEIHENRYDYEKLKELEEKAVQRLHIKI